MSCSEPGTGAQTPSGEITPPGTGEEGQWRILSLVPNPLPGGRAQTLRVQGEGFSEGDEVSLNGGAIATRFVGPGTLEVSLEALVRGTFEVRVRRGAATSEPAELEVSNAPPLIHDPGPVQVAEGETLTLTLDAEDLEGDPLRLGVSGLPPGATFDAASDTLTFSPDAIQGGLSWSVTLTVDDGIDTARREVVISALDTIRPPEPRVVRTEDLGAVEGLELEQRTDALLDSPGQQGRTYRAFVMAPRGATAQDPKPVRIVLHGFDGEPWQEAWEGEFRISPHDPDNTYWWGHAEQVPGGEPVQGAVHDYTQRRILHLLGWVLARYPGADRRRVYVEGASMGGAGAATFGLLHARHVAWVSATIGQTIPRNHRPERLAQLSTLWGSPEANLDSGQGVGVWDYMDLTDALARSSEARGQFIFVRHGKDDPIIHFGAVVLPSPKTGLSFYRALQHHRVGHLAVWDEGAHGPPDPVLGPGWWERGWNPIFDEVSFLRADLSFPAMTASSADDDPGDGSGNGRVPWSEASGFAGSLDVPGDTGWSGAVAGALGRLLRWDANLIVDTAEVWEVPLRVLEGEGGPAPREGYPMTGDRLGVEDPIIVAVTPRRLQAFRPRPGERLQWTFGQSQSGTVIADGEGVVTIEGIALTRAWQTLRVGAQ